MSEKGLFDEIYRPDVLQCIANLSNDEIFTPPEIVNQMLDLLPQELFCNPNTTFLDPCCKSGVFLREIAKRLIEGLKDTIPDLQERIDHIMHQQLYGIAITELTSLLSRRSLYCSKYPNSIYSISKFNDVEGNIRFRRILHSWKGNKCKYCGAPKNEYDRGEELETYAYEWIHVIDTKEILNMKFDVICGNPPYQLNDGGGTGDSAKPIYNLFIEQSIKLNPKYLTMIIPSRWMKGGKGLDSFRKSMIEDTKISYICDFEKSDECFPNLHIDGGVCYFLRDRNYYGPVEYIYNNAKGEQNKSMRFLKTNLSSTVFRDYRQISIIQKIKEKTNTSFSTIVSNRKPWGIATDLFNHPENYGPDFYSETPKTNYIKIYGVKGKKGGAKRVIGYVNKNKINQATSDIQMYNLLFSYAYSTDATVPPQPIIAKPNEISTETFLKIGSFDTYDKAYNCYSYLTTKFFRALLYFNRIQKNASQKTFEFIPLLDFSKAWADEDLYKQFSLTQEEIDYIENCVDDMTKKGYGEI